MQGETTMGRNTVSAVGLLCILLGGAQSVWAAPNVNRTLRYVYAGVALQDIVHTTGCVSRGVCREQNWTFTPIVRKWGIESAMLVKGAEHGAIIYAAQMFEESHPTATRNVLIGLIAAQVAVNIRNYQVLRKAGLK